MKNYYNADNRIIAATKAAVDNAFQTLEGLEAQTMMLTGHKARYYINGKPVDRSGAIRCINDSAPFITEIRHSEKYGIKINIKDEYYINI